MANGFDNDITVVYKLGQIEGKLDALSLVLSEHIKNDVSAKAVLNEKIHGLERSRSWAVGAVAIISIGITSLSQLIWRALGINT